MVRRDRRPRATSKARPSRGALVQQAVALTPPGGLPGNYGQVLQEIKSRVREVQTRAATAVNRELIALYLQIGGLLSKQIEAAGWGDMVVERLAADLRKAFPPMKGFSRRNLFYMRQVHDAWAGADEAVLDSVHNIPWGHHLVLLTKVTDREARLFYVRQTVAQGWSRAVLTVQIEARLHERKGKALTNFRQTLPPQQSELAHQTLKDPYVFDFLTLTDDAQERDVEQALVDHVQRFLLELGVGFAFVGRQVHLEVGGEDFYIDLLFYHLKLRCYVVVDLKVVPFKPEFAGKMSFYLSAVDDRMRHPSDAPSIGLLLCKSKNRFIVEYALRDLAKPIGVAQWETRLVERLPENLKGNLPSVEELEAELA